MGDHGAGERKQKAAAQKEADKAKAWAKANGQSESMDLRTEKEQTADAELAAKGGPKPMTEGPAPVPFLAEPGKPEMMVMEAMPLSLSCLGPPLEHVRCPSSTSVASWTRCAAGRPPLPSRRQVPLQRRAANFLVEAPCCRTVTSGCDNSKLWMAV